MFDTLICLIWLRFALISCKIIMYLKMMDEWNDMRGNWYGLWHGWSYTVILGNRKCVDGMVLGYLKFSCLALETLGWNTADVRG